MASACSSALPSRLADQHARVCCPLRSTRVTGLHRYYKAVRPCTPPRYSAPRSCCCLGASLSRLAGIFPEPPLYRSCRFPRSAQEPEPGSRHLHAGHHLGGRQVSPRLLPRQRLLLGFDVFATLSTLHQWFTRVRLPGSYLTPSWAPFPQRSPLRLLTGAACGGLEPPPARRLRRTSLHLLCSIASSGLYALIATTFRVRGTQSSAYRTAITSPRASRRPHRAALWSNT